MMVVTVTTEPTFRVSRPEVLFDGRYSRRAFLNYDVSSDGQRFVMISVRHDGDPEASASTTLVLVQNWFEELKRLMPTE